MQKQFTQFADNIRLTDSQEADAKTKYDGVCKKLHDSYYDNEYDGKTKLIFGSYKTKTNVRPITENQDVDVLFKIPKATYDKFKAYKSNGPSALLQEVKGFLNEKYTTTDEIKAWGKIVQIKFADNAHNVEVLPAYEEEDGTFTIPNSENGGSWDKFNPREQITLFQNSNSKTNGLTAELTRMIKTWVDNTSTCNYKSYTLLGNVMKFLETNFKTGADYSDYSNVVKSFFEYLYSNCEEEIQSFVKTALDRAQKAYDYEKDKKPKEASEEWRKIFGFEGKSEFPRVSSNPVKESNTRVFTNPSAPYGNYKTNC
jgi:hypothetical protein